MFNNGSNIHASIIAETKYNIPHPRALAPPADANNPIADKQINQKLSEKRLDMLIKCKNILDVNIQCLYSFIFGQWIDLIQTKLKQQAI